MKKVIKWGVLALVLLLVIAVPVVYLRLGAIVEYLVESQGSQQMNLTTQLNDASVSLIGGSSVELDGLTIDNPPGFTSPHLFSLGEVDVAAPLGQLRGNPKRVSQITLDKPKLVIERSPDGRFNFKTAIDQMPKPTGPADPQQPAPTPQPQPQPQPAPQPAPPAGDEMKLIIDELLIKDAVVLVRPGLNLPGVAQEITVPVPTVSLKNIGNADNAQNGAALRDVAQQVITVMAANASNSNLLPEELRGLMNLDVNAVVAELGTRLGAEAQKRVAAAVPGELGARLAEVVADPNALVKDPNKAADAVRENVGKVLEQRGIPRNVDEVTKDPSKAVEGIQGLLGGTKERDREKDRGRAKDEDRAAPPPDVK